MNFILNTLIIILLFYRSSIAETKKQLCRHVFEVTQIAHKEDKDIVISRVADLFLEKLGQNDQKNKLLLNQKSKFIKELEENYGTESVNRLYEILKSRQGIVESEKTQRIKKTKNEIEEIKNKRSQLINYYNNYYKIYPFGEKFIVVFKNGDFFVLEYVNGHSNFEVLKNSNFKFIGDTEIINTFSSNLILLKNNKVIFFDKYAIPNYISEVMFQLDQSYQNIAKISTTGFSFTILYKDGTFQSKGKSSFEEGLHRIKHEFNSPVIDVLTNFSNTTYILKNNKVINVSSNYEYQPPEIVFGESIESKIASLNHNHLIFVALKKDGKIRTWGDPLHIEKDIELKNNDQFSSGFKKFLITSLGTVLITMDNQIVVNNKYQSSSQKINQFFGNDNVDIITADSHFIIVKKKDNTLFVLKKESFEDNFMISKLPTKNKLFLGADFILFHDNNKVTIIVDGKDFDIDFDNSRKISKVEGFSDEVLIHYDDLKIHYLHYQFGKVVKSHEIESFMTSPYLTHYSNNNYTLFQGEDGQIYSPNNQFSADLPRLNKLISQELKK